MVKKREANFELLRIIAMFMIITLHYLYKGGLLTEYVEIGKIDDMLYWLLECICAISVNVFVLITGYFWSEKEWHWKRLISFWFQVLFYSLMIPIFLCLFGILPIEYFDKYKILGYVAPIVTEQYWFATTYLLLLLFIPFLNAGIKQFTKRQHAIFCFVFIGLFSISKSVILVSLPWDKAGYDILWFITLYLIAAFIKKYYSPIKTRGLMYGSIFVISIFIMYLWVLASSVVYNKYGKLSELIDLSCDYNYIFNLVAAISLFLIFAQMKIKSTKVSKVICAISPYVFGVYLLHEHIEIRYLWTEWFRVSEERGFLGRMVNMLGSVIIIFAVGILIDYLRDKLFRLLVKGKPNKKDSEEVV